MKFLIAAGHEGTTGAVSGKFVEEVLTEQLAHKIVDVLVAQGHDALEPDFNLWSEVSKSYFKEFIKGTDYVVDLHFNWHSGTGHGTEVYIDKYRKADDIKVETALMDKLGKWFTVRHTTGIVRGEMKTPKVLAGLGVKGSLLEVCFLTSKKDMEVYLNNIDEIARDIAHALIEGLGGSVRPVSKSDPINGPFETDEATLWFRAVAGSFRMRVDAQREVDRLNKEFTDKKLTNRKAWLQAVQVPKLK